MNISDQNHALSLYLVSFRDWSMDEYDAFIVAAFTEEEAEELTPQQDKNHEIGTRLGYDCPQHNFGLPVLYYDRCGRGKSIQRVGAASEAIGWGEVVLASFNAGSNKVRLTTWPFFTKNQSKLH
jgi:hypothetical protein